MSQAATIQLHQFPACGSCTGTLGGQIPAAPACCGWVLVPALLQQELILSPSPESWGPGATARHWCSCPGSATQRPGRHNGWKAAACIEQWEPPLCWPRPEHQAAPQPCSLWGRCSRGSASRAQLLWPMRGHQPCLGSRLPLTAVSRSWPRVATCAGAAD